MAMSGPTRVETSQAALAVSASLRQARRKMVPTIGPGRYDYQKSAAGSGVYCPRHRDTRPSTLAVRVPSLAGQSGVSLIAHPRWQGRPVGHLSQSWRWCVAQ